MDYIAQWIDKTGFSMYFTQVYQATFDVIAFWIVLPLHTLMQRRRHRSLTSRHNSLVCLSTAYSATKYSDRYCLDRCWRDTRSSYNWAHHRMGLCTFSKTCERVEAKREDTWKCLAVFTSLIPIIVIVTLRLSVQRFSTVVQNDCCSRSMDICPASHSIVHRHVVWCAFIRFLFRFMVIWSSWICDGQWVG